VDYTAIGNKELVQDGDIICNPNLIKRGVIKFYSNDGSGIRIGVVELDSGGYLAAINGKLIAPWTLVNNKEGVEDE